MGVAFLLISAVACTGDEPDARSRASAGPTSSSARTGASAPSGEIPDESVTKAPELPDGVVIAKVDEGKGQQEVPIKGGLAAGTVAIAVNCQGMGVLKVTLLPVELTFPLNCSTGEVSSTYNEIHLKRSRPEASIKIETSSQVRWSMTAGQ